MGVRRADRWPPVVARGAGASEGVCAPRTARPRRGEVRRPLAAAIPSPEVVRPGGGTAGLPARACCSMRPEARWMYVRGGPVCAAPGPSRARSHQPSAVGADPRDARDQRQRGRDRWPAWIGWVERPRLYGLAVRPVGEVESHDVPPSAKRATALRDGPLNPSVGADGWPPPGGDERVQRLLRRHVGLPTCTDIAPPEPRRARPQKRHGHVRLRRRIRRGRRRSTSGRGGGLRHFRRLGCLLRHRLRRLGG